MTYLIKLLDALAHQDGAALLAIADEMAARSASYSGALQDLGSLLHRIALAQTVPSAVPEDLPERDDVMRLATAFDAEEIQLFYQIVVHGRNELGLAPDEYAGFTMTLLRMLAFRPGMSSAEALPSAPVPVAAKTSPVPTTPARASSVVPSTAAVSSTRPAAGLSPARAALDAARGIGKGQAPKAAPAPAPTWPEEKPQNKEHPAAATPRQAPQRKTEPDIQQDTTDEPVVVLEAETLPAITLGVQTGQVPLMPSVSVMPPAACEPVPALDWNGNWPELAAALPLRGVVQQLAQQSELIRCEQIDQQFQMRLRVPIETLCSAASVDKLAATLSEHFGKPVRIVTEIGAVRQTANAQAEAQRAVRQREAEQAMNNDPFVQTLMREFGATIVPGSIKPI